MTLYFLSIILVLLLPTNHVLALDSQNGLLALLQDKLFIQRITIAGITALLSFIIAWLMYIVQRRRSRKQVLYDLEETKPFRIETDELRRKFEIRFGGRKVDDILYVRCTVRNSGATLVKNQMINFSFPSSATILEAHFEPEPPPQIGLVEDNDHATTANERSFKISYFPRRLQVTFSFLIDTGSQPCQSTVFGMSTEHEDLDFAQGNVKRFEDDMKKAISFLTLLLLFFIVPAVIPPVPYVAFGVSLVEMVIFVLMIPVIRPFCRILAEFLLRRQEAKDLSVVIGRDVKNSVIVAGDENYARMMGEREQSRSD